MPPDPDSHWKQYRGDPAIRGGLFEQCRTHSVMDEHLGDVFAQVDKLMRHHGVFHAKLHFSSSRATLWLYTDPCRYRVLSVEELLTATPCLDCPLTRYPAEAVVESRLIPAVLEGFRTLRYADDQIYLRAGSLNLINGMVGLNFSCDGSHYQGPVHTIFEPALLRESDGCKARRAGKGHPLPSGATQQTRFIAATRRGGPIRGAPFVASRLL